MIFKSLIVNMYNHKLNLFNISSLFYNKINIIKTKNKYFVILFGPTGSGKTYAATKSLNIISNDDHLNETINMDNLKNTFVNISIDDIIYTHIFTDMNNLSGKNILVNNFHNFIKLNNLSYDNLCDILINDKLLYDELSKQSENLYFNMRKQTDSLSYVILHYAIYHNLNIFFETIGNNHDYIINNVIKSICEYYNYIPIIIYPKVSYDNILSRVINRGIKEGRFPSINNINKYINECYNSYEIIKQTKFNNIILCDFDNNEHHNIVNNNIINYSICINNNKLNKSIV